MQSNVARVSEKESPAFRYGENVNEPTNHAEIYELLKKHGKIAIRTQTGILRLIKNNGRYFYEVNKCVVGISAKSLNGIIDRIPENIGVIGWE